jgi:hypothetical protein
MLRKLLLTLISVSLWVGGHTASAQAAIHAPEDNSQFHRLTQEGLQVQSDDAEHRGIALEPPSPFGAPVGDATQAPQEYCLWDIAVVAGCQPLPGSPLSAFPIVFSPDLPRH